jgi:hypothetical protein
MRSRLRPLLAIIVTLALLSGLVAHAAQARMTSMMMAGTGCTMAEQDSCPGNGGGRAMHRLSCDEFCAGPVALIPILIGAMVMNPGSFTDAVLKASSSVIASPDPSPPRRSL